VAKVFSGQSPLECIFFPERSNLVEFLEAQPLLCALENDRVFEFAQRTVEGPDATGLVMVRGDGFIQTHLKQAQRRGAATTLGARSPS
jgi:hypothetical protein